MNTTTLASTTRPSPAQVARLVLASALMAMTALHIQLSRGTPELPRQPAP